MAYVSLVFPAMREGSPSFSDVHKIRHALEAGGHQVEVVIAFAENVPPRREDDFADCVQVECRLTGRAAVAITGLMVAQGDYLVVLDSERGYTTSDVIRVVETLKPTDIDVVVASRLIPGDGTKPVVLPRAILGQFLNKLTGSSDPLSGLMGLTREVLREATPAFKAVGSQFSLELLAKVKGRRCDVPACPTSARRLAIRPGFDDVRHLKHLADHRFGNVSRLMQFCVVGASGMMVDLTTYALLQEILFRVPWMATTKVPPTQVPYALAVARGLAILTALVWNFSLNRRLTFSYARSGSIIRQFVAYGLSNLLGISVSMALSLGLPSRVPFFQDHKLLAAVIGIVAATGLSFSMSRWLVFRRSANTLHHLVQGTEPPLVRRPNATDSALAESPAYH